MTKWLTVLIVCSAVRVQAADAPGKMIYEKFGCASCHGIDGKGNPGMAKIFGVDLKKMDFTQVSTTAKDEEIKKAIDKGQGKMPAYGTRLKPEDIDALVAYIRSLAPPSK